MSRARVVITLALALVLPLLTGAQATAAPISATEILEDPAPYELLFRNLTRTRFSSVMAPVVETNDATIIADNNINGAFGVLTSGDVTYSHVLGTWLNPPAMSYLTAVLTIEAWSPVANDDLVIVETVNLGSLSAALLGFSTTVFTDGALLAKLVDGRLDITVNKNAPGGFANLNAFSVFRSRLDVRYEPVPEPTTLALLGVALVGLARRMRSAA